MVIEKQQEYLDELGHLDRRVYVSEEVYRQELEKVFGRAWQFIGHDSLVPNPNDFFLTYMGEDPVILTRDSKGELHAFLNMCRHRGNRVARADDGNAKNFMCTYHGWTYSNEGKLVSVPGLQEAYYGELEVDKLGLVSVAQLDTYAGLIFATWDPEAPPFEDYLGDARWYVDLFFNRREGGTEFIGPEKWIIPSNWKNPADNISGDNYHVAVSHRSAVLARAKSMGVDPPPTDQSYKQSGSGFTGKVGYGHGVGVRMAKDDEEFWRLFNIQQRLPALLKYQKDVLPETEQRLGHTRAYRVLPGVGNIFPNMGYLPGQYWVSMWLPRGLHRTEVWRFLVFDKAATREEKDVMRVFAEQSFGASGMLEQDDMDNWRQCSESGESVIARRYPQNLSMGIAHQTRHPVVPGLLVASTLSEQTQRSFYGGWQQLINAATWKDIPVPERTAMYEGTATFKG